MPRFTGLFRAKPRAQSWRKGPGALNLTGDIEQHVNASLRRLAWLPHEPAATKGSLARQGHSKGQRGLQHDASDSKWRRRRPIPAVAC